MPPFSSTAPAHTAGPWEVEYVIDGAFEIRHVEDGDYCLIASRGSIPARHKEFVANALLISKSPELLAALKQLRAVVAADRCARPACGCDASRRLAHVDAVIAAAEGRS